MIEMFHRDFDSETYQGTSAGDLQAQNVSYTQQQLDQLLEIERQIGHDEGYQIGSDAGRKAATDELDTEFVEALSSLNQKIEEMQLNVGSHRDQLEKHTLSFMQKVLQKILPSVKSEYASDCTAQIVQHCLDMVASVPAIEIRVSPKTKTQLVSNGIGASNSTEHAVDINIVEDTTKSDGDVWVGWDGGWARYSLDDVCAQIMNKIQTALAQAETSKD